MELLPKEIVKSGFRYIQKKRTDKTAIYDQWLLIGHNELNDEKTKAAGKKKYDFIIDSEEWVAYEVFHIRRQKETTLPNGIILKEKELFPSNEGFGVYAYCCKELKRAEMRFNELEKRYANSSEEEIVDEDTETDEEEVLEENE